MEARLTTVLLAASAVARMLAAPAQSPAQSATVDWASGKASWKQATQATSGDERLWTQPNFCDSRVLHSSAPLTVLFGVSTFWDEIKHRRASLAQVDGATATASKPLELHVLGAAYPFEGRSDWSLLASRRPADVPSVRVVLVLGTPWHMDNVPRMTMAKEFDENRSFLMQLGAAVRNTTRSKAPETGKISGGELKCDKKGDMTKEDKTFTKADLCKDHGNGLEVVCIEKYYQAVEAELPKPDAVVMFSPGFPQIARRSWDLVLRHVLSSEVPVMVCDLVYADSIPDAFKNGKGKHVRSGGKWSVKRTRFEDGMTLRAMRAYGARRLGAYRNPFPILIDRGHGDFTAKNAVLQVFRGRLNHAKPWKFESAKKQEHRKKVIGDVKMQLDSPEDVKEIRDSMLVSTSKAYDRGMWQIYRDQIRDAVKEQIQKKKARNVTIDPKWMAMVEKMGLTGNKRKKPWTLKEWVFVLEKLKVADEFF